MQNTPQKPWWLNITILLISALLALTAWWLVPAEPHTHAPAMAGLIVLMAVWWITEVIPIPVTALLPLVVLPALDIASVKDVAPFYGKEIIFLFLGGFLLALGLQQSGLHKRIALRIVMLIGGNPRRVVLGFMLATGFLSAWISNTASVMVMMPIGLSILGDAKERGAEAGVLGTFGVALMLGIAYAADIGGMGTLIGTPPNLVFLELFQDLFPKAPKIGFLDWMMFGIPIAVVFMATGWLLLTRVIFRLPKNNLLGSRDTIAEHYAQLGPVRRDEIFAGAIFGLAALLWLTGSDLQFSDQYSIPGWRSLTGLEPVSDAAVAVATAFLLFVIPSKDRAGNALLEWETAQKGVPWGILLLFGGGFAIAGGFEITGLSDIVASLFVKFEDAHPVFVVVVVCFFLTFLTEFTSNTATTNLVLPILAKASVVLGIDPRLLMIPATLSASCAFMMPVASPTQAIVFGSGHVNIRQMIRAGIWFNFLGIIIVTVLFLLLGEYFLGIDHHVLPEWAVGE